jgi:hypothetical protein
MMTSWPSAAILGTKSAVWMPYAELTNGALLCQMILMGSSAAARGTGGGHRFERLPGGLTSTTCSPCTQGLPLPVPGW